MRVRKIIKKEVDVQGLGVRIREAREKDGRSLTRLAKEVGVSRNYWYLIESESVDLAEDTLRKIETILGVDLGVSFDCY